MVSYVIAFFNNSKQEHGFLFEIKPEQIKHFKWLFHFRKRKDGTVLKTCYYTQVFSVLRFMLSIVAAIVVGLIESAFFQKTSLLILFIGYITITGILESCFRLVTFIIDYFKTKKNKSDRDKAEASVNWLKSLTILLVVLIVSSATGLIVLSSIHMKYEGEIEGTDFVIQEYFGAGDIDYDVDDYGNIYFAGFNWGGGFVLVYDSNGEYLYTIKISTSGSVGVNIDDENNILVYVTRQGRIIHYTNDGLLDFIEEDVPYSRQRDFLHYTGDSTRLRKGISYINKNRTITRIENDKETIVFTVPVWQRWFRAFKLILIFSCIGLFLRIGIPLWVKEFRKMNKNIERIKKEQAQRNVKLP